MSSLVPLDNLEKLGLDDLLLIDIPVSRSNATSMRRIVSLSKRMARRTSVSKMSSTNIVVGGANNGFMGGSGFRKRSTFDKDVIMNLDETETGLDQSCQNI